jgi:uncharacterized surface protein with fasciclin (FAS1) repeats
MKYKFSKILFPATIFLLLATAQSCTDNWNNHYGQNGNNDSQDVKINLSLYDYIKSSPNLSDFAQMIDIAGYDTLLSAKQTFTVWAPTNTALQGVDMNNTVEVRKIVGNHITRFSTPTTSVIGKTQRILMMNGKYLPFGIGGSGFTLDGKSVAQPDISLQNGILHIMSEYAPYKLSIWEFIQSTEGLDSLRVYLNSLTQRELDYDKSYSDDLFIDSVFMETNYVLDYLAKINEEDTVYTALLPDNTAWTQTYSSILPYFNMTRADSGAVRQRKMAQIYMVKDLFFEKELTLPITADSLQTTWGTKLMNPARFFDGATPHVMSNGIGYVKNAQIYEPKDSWLQILNIEAETERAVSSDGSERYKREEQNYSVSRISGLGTGYSISNYYIKCTPKIAGTANKLSVKFPIPGTLSAKYNIYCTFVPSSIDKVTDHRSCKARFYVSYIDANGNVATDRGVRADNLTTTPLPSQTAIFTTKPDVIDKMLVLKDFTFTYSNLLNLPGEKNEVNNTRAVYVALKVENAADDNTTEAKSFDRTIRIDNIILEPVLE